MKLQKLLSSRTSGLLVATLAGALSVSADTFSVMASAPGVETPSAMMTTHYETFDTASTTGGTYTTDFNGSGIMGTFSGAFGIKPADYFGGAGGVGNYAVTYIGLNYTLSLNAGASYFGAWFSALDPGSQVTFYNGSTMVYQASGTSLMAGLGSCPGTSYCGNPSGAFMGADPAQPYAYLNFMDTNGSFNSIMFAENAGGNGFELDNVAVATPEPASVGLLLLGAAASVAAYRRRRSSPSR